MSRYKDTIVKLDKDSGSRVYGLTIYPRIPIQDGDLFISPTEGDRLESLAFRYYEDTSLWWVIAEANNLRDGRFALDPNKELRIPINLAPILLEFRDLNSGGSSSTGGSPGGGGGGGY